MWSEPVTFGGGIAKVYVCLVSPGSSEAAKNPELSQNSYQRDSLSVGEYCLGISSVESLIGPAVCGEMAGQSSLSRP
jgi:hypothetical protein